MTTSSHEHLTVPAPAPRPDADRFSMDLSKFIELMTGRKVEPWQAELLRFVEGAQGMQVHGSVHSLDETFDKVKQRLPYLFEQRGSLRQDVLAAAALANRRMLHEYERVCARPYLFECAEQHRLRHFHARSGIDRPRFSSFSFRGAGFRTTASRSYAPEVYGAEFSSHIHASMLLEPKAAFALND